MSERDTNATSGSSPYDEPTGEIDAGELERAAAENPPSGPRATAGEALTRRPSTTADRDSFYARHATDPGRGVSRVDDLDDLDPDDVDTTAIPAGTPRSATGRPRAGSTAPTVPAPAAPGSDPAGPPAAGPPRAGSGAAGFGATGPATPKDPADPTVAFPAAAPVTSAKSGRRPAPDPAEPVADETATTAFAAGDPLPPAAPEFDAPTFDSPAAYDSPETRHLYDEADHDEPSDRRLRVAEDELEDAERRARRGTLDIGLLLLRVGVGAILVAHGAQKLFGLWNGPRLSGFEDFLLNSTNPAIGFTPDAARPLAIVGAITETLSGVLLVVGLFTPVAAAGALGVLLIAGAYKSTLAGGVWFFAADGNGSGIEYELLLALAAAVIILTGPGRIALDAPRGWARRPSWGSLLLLLVGIGAAVAVWMVFNGTNPFNSPGNG
ncbi:DoxX family membrane protein [Gordonia soli]|uniref:DoxX family protein n=1 Tax=Gordonia soli NBRC 108243 TaxID=1223545 RepID=M0QD31_9ACTN|nr:DoxX family protein [Gordonia soli]GAC66339.1 hypothetical protein GS4_02_00490 [Gordonia soli NBRC 108243]